MSLESISRSLLSGAIMGDGASWRDYVQPASYKGIPFLTDSDDMGGGRRGATHEYPYRDTPENEDMGHKAREYKLTAYVLGDDYQRQRDRLLGALEAGGIGELTHPEYGIQKVFAKTWNVRHSTTRGREAAIDITFVQEGKTRLHQNYPTIKTNVSASAYKLYSSDSTAMQAAAAVKLKDWLA